nr:long-chain-alcohol oxidase FAO4A [Ipomoea batatas]
MENKSATKTLSPSQMETLSALCNTFLPAINEPLPETTDASVTNFFQTSAASTGTPHQVDDKGDNPSWKGIGYCGPDPSISEKQKKQKHHDHEDDDIAVADIEELLFGPLYNGIIDLNQPEEHVFNRLTKLGGGLLMTKDLDMVLLAGFHRGRRLNGELVRFDQNAAVCSPGMARTPRPRVIRKRRLSESHGHSFAVILSRISRKTRRDDQLIAAGAPSGCKERPEKRHGGDVVRRPCEIRQRRDPPGMRSSGSDCVACGALTTPSVADQQRPLKNRNIGRNLRLHPVRVRSGGVWRRDTDPGVTPRGGLLADLRNLRPRQNRRGESAERNREAVKEASREEFERFVKEESSQGPEQTHTNLKGIGDYQMGSCRMGVDPKTSVVNPKGETMGRWKGCLLEMGKCSSYKL